MALTGDLASARGAAAIRDRLADFTVVPQRGNDFGERLANAHHDAACLGYPVLQIGMDTPQTTSAHLDAAMTELAGPGTDAVLGMANDGGWWIIGLHRADPAVFLDIPMSCSDTGVLQRRRLIDLGLAVRDIEPLTDVDSIDDALLVGSLAPDTRFARALAAMSPRRAGVVSAPSPTTVLRSTDGGLNWEECAFERLNGEPLMSAARLPSGAWLAVGAFGRVLRSEDDGKTWAPQAIPGLSDWHLNSIGGAADGRD